MAVTAQRITVSTSAVAISPAEADVVGGCKLLVKNTSANAADLGPSGVTAGAGYDLAAGASVVIELGPGEGQVFAIRLAAADAVLSVLRVGV
jgi:hypothetical protein